MTFNDEQYRKRFVPIYVTVAMWMDSNDVQSLNAQDPIDCNPFGSWMDFNVLHRENPFCPIEVTDGGMITRDKDKQPAKVAYSILVIDGGIVILESDEHFQNAIIPISVSEFGKLISDRLVLSRNAHGSIVSSDSGRSMDVKDEQP